MKGFGLEASAVLRRGTPSEGSHPSQGLIQLCTPAESYSASWLAKREYAAS